MSTYASGVDGCERQCCRGFRETSASPALVIDHEGCSETVPVESTPLTDSQYGVYGPSTPSVIRVVSGPYNALHG